MSINVDPLRLSKPQDSSTYLAIKTTQGGRAVYTTRVPLLDLPTILPVPDPNNVDKDNRKVDRLHAKHFGEYLDTKQDWVAPALLARDGGGCTFEKSDYEDFPFDDHSLPKRVQVEWHTVSVVEARRPRFGFRLLRLASTFRSPVISVIYRLRRKG